MSLHRAQVGWLPAVGLGALLAAGCVAGSPAGSSSSELLAASATATPSTHESAPASPGPGLVPWVDRPAAHYMAPTPSYPPTDARPCGPADVHATSGQEGFGLGNSNLPVTFVNRSDSACVLSGFPTLDGIDIHGVAHSISVSHGSYFGDPGPSANLAPGESAALNISGADACPAILAGQRRIYPVLGIGLPAGGSVNVAGDGFDTICGVSVSAFGVPAAAAAADGPSPLPLTASIAAPASVLAGTTLDYVVTLANPTAADFPLIPCPSYEEFVGSGSGTVWVATIRDYALDCDTVHAIPARGSVSFDMRLAIPPDQPAGMAKFGWDMQVDRGPWANAPLQVQPAG